MSKQNWKQGGTTVFECLIIAALLASLATVLVLVLELDPQDRSGSQAVEVVDPDSISERIKHLEEGDWIVWNDFRRGRVSVDVDQPSRRILFENSDQPGVQLSVPLNERTANLILEIADGMSPLGLRFAEEWVEAEKKK